MKIEELFSTKNDNLRNKLWEKVWNQLEKAQLEADRKINRQLKIEKAGLKSFCQEKRNFNQLQISATQAEAQNILGGFWV